jgi:hypothetical protein
MIDVFAAFEVLEAAATKENPIQTIASAKLLYSLYQDAKAGKVNVTEFADAAKLTSVVDAVVLLGTVAQKIMANPAEAPEVLTLIKSAE